MSILQRSQIDWITIALYVALLIIGWMMLHAASYDPNQVYAYFDFGTIIGKQTIWVGLSVLVFLATLTIDWKFWQSTAYPIYAVTLFLLLLVLLVGVEIKGARSWFGFSGFSIQPSEFAKFGTAIAVSSYLSYFKSDLRQWRSIFVCLGLIGIPMFLILLQPDAGSALVFSSFFILFFRNGLSPTLYIISLGMLAILILSLIFSPKTVVLLLSLPAMLILINKLRFDRWNYLIMLASTTFVLFLFYAEYLWYSLGLAIILILIFGAIAYFNRFQRLALLIVPTVLLGSLISFGSKFAFDHGLKPHQQERIKVWLRPHECDPRGSLYNILQSKTAIGSGGWQGKGFLEGDFTKLNYVPEQTTDFIFSTVGEEQGFLGVLGVILLFLFLMIQITRIAERAKNKFITNYAYAVAGIIFIHFFVNIGMSMGVMPVIGIPLPFISKGGSALMGFSIMLGVLVKMDMARFSR